MTIRKNKSKLLSILVVSLACCPSFNVHAISVSKSAPYSVFDNKTLQFLIATGGVGTVAYAGFAAYNLYVKNCYLKTINQLQRYLQADEKLLGISGLSKKEYDLLKDFSSENEADCKAYVKELIVKYEGLATGAMDKAGVLTNAYQSIGETRLVKLACQQGTLGSVALVATGVATVGSMIYYDILGAGLGVIGLLNASDDKQLTSISGSLNASSTRPLKDDGGCAEPRVYGRDVDLDRGIALSLEEQRKREQEDGQIEEAIRQSLEEEAAVRAVAAPVVVPVVAPVDVPAGDLGAGVGVLAGDPVVAGPDARAGDPVVAGPDARAGDPVVAGPDARAGDPVVAGPDARVDVPAVGADELVVAPDAPWWRVWGRAMPVWGAAAPVGVPGADAVEEILAVAGDDEIEEVRAVVPDVPGWGVWLGWRAPAAAPVVPEADAVEEIPAVAADVPVDELAVAPDAAGWGARFAGWIRGA